MTTDTLHGIGLFYFSVTLLSAFFFAIEYEPKAALLAPAWPLIWLKFIWKNL